jgi:enoyl-[acyl-carrier protein] reductase I
MIPINLSGKVALVTGVGDDFSFAWHIARGLQAAGARLLFAVHPWFISIVENILVHEGYAEARVLPYGAGTLTVEKAFPCDVRFDSMADVPEDVRQERRFKRCEQQHGDYSIQGLMERIGKDYKDIDILIHSIAFSREIKTHKAFETSRGAYLEALSISAYSLTALLRAALPFMENRPDGTSAVGLTYIGGERVIPHYAGGMSTAKAALQIDAKQLASNLGPRKIRVNLISAGPYASRAAKGIGDIEKMKQHAAERSPLPRAIDAEEVASATAFLCSSLASAITGQVLYVDCGYNVMGV